MDAISLDLDEGVPLGYALVARIAADHEIPVLAIKGPTLSQLGLRAPRRSLDIDVLVDPARLNELLGALSRAGWGRFAAGGPSGQVIPPHSVPLTHESWPAEIDVHHYFPGFLADPAVVFGVLWRDRTVVDLAGQQVVVPSRPASAAVALLHLLRGGARRERELDQLVSHLSAALSPDEGRTLAQLAAETAADGTLAPALGRLGLARTDHLETSEPANAAWELARRSGGAHTVGWLLTFRHSPVHTWPRLAWRALWLTETELRTRYPGARPGQLGLAGMWLSRWWTGLRALPRAVLLLRDQRHKSSAPRPARTDD